MRSEPHPISGFHYEAVGEGHVRVENPRTGKHGLFHWDGRWIEGDITHADIHFLRFIGGPDLAPEDDVLWTRLPLAIAPTPPDAYYVGRLPEGQERIVGKYDPLPGKTTPLGTRSAGHVDLAYLLDNDRKPERVPEVYRLESPMPDGPQRISTRRYFDPRYHEREVEKIWGKTWQMACRADDIPNVGDYHVYTVANLSWIIVRTGEDAFRAHQNVCLHRGRILRDHDGTAATEFRCPYHGWSWKLDGTLKEMTCEWDFPGVKEDVNQLPGAQVATWAGWVFINPDPEAMPLEEFLGPVMMAHYEQFDMDSRWKQAHVTRMMPANWKGVMEAFMEGWHVVGTHPQLLLMGYDQAADRYDVFGHWGRAGHVASARSSSLRNMMFPDEEILALHRSAADSAREYFRPILGDKVDSFSDAELTDISYNDLFPNFHPWGGFARINFRFRPDGNNPEKALMDVILLAPWPKDKPKPPSATHRILTDDQSWCDAPELGTLARVLDQDLGNMEAVQKGIKAKKPEYIWCSDYQEGKIRNFHRNYDRWMELNDDGEF